jgi:hypothetical protein
MTPAINTTSKTPYWARDEDDDQPQAQQHTATPIVRRKHVATSPGAITVTDTSIPPIAQSIPRKPVPVQPAAEPVLVYTPFEGNPYTDSAQQWTNQTNPESLTPVAQVVGYNTAQQPEVSLSPAPTKKSKATGVLSRGFGTIKKATGRARRSLETSGETKISTPIAGNYHRSGLNSPVVMTTPLHLVGIEVAQADVPRYGKPDHLLASPHIAYPRDDSLGWLTGEPVPTQPSAASAAPPAPDAPVPTRSKSRKVVNDSDRETLFGDIIAAAQDSSWVDDSQTQAKGQARGEENGQRNASGILASATMPQLFTIPSSGNPFAARVNPSVGPASLGMSRQPTNLDKSLPSSPAPSSMRRQTTVNNPAYAPRYDGSRFAESLESGGARRASYVPGIKCSDCGKMIDPVQVSDHRCGRRPAQAVDRDDWQPAGLSRADTYASNYGRRSRLSPAIAWGRDYMQSLSGLQGHETGFVDNNDESDVVVDTFVRSDHTSWRGVVHSDVGSDVQPMTGHISGGSEGVRRSNRVDEANYWRNGASRMS